MNVMYQRPKGMAQAWPTMEFEGVKGIEPVLQAWARKLKDHPALLGYYVSDENPVEEVPYMRKVRELLNEADPDHFTVTLTYIGRHFPFFAETGGCACRRYLPGGNRRQQKHGGNPGSAFRRRSRRNFPLAGPAGVQLGQLQDERPE